MTPTSSFRLSKSTKRALASGRFQDEHQRNQFKRSMIQAELAGAVQPRSKKGDRDDQAR